ncbi:MAG: hypothetical protein HZA91_03285 [Verrucomicrobia bacterium]|nr:hypothetical protein [Verrucomicrobiota bacterium]
MKKLLAICLWLPLTAGAMDSTMLRQRLQQAASASGQDYIRARAAILTEGKANQLALQKAAEDDSLTWQQRLMARICCEWVEREPEIVALRKYACRTDPEYQKHEKEWRPYRCGDRPLLMSLLQNAFKEKRLWYYYLELLWKRTGEYGEDGGDMLPTRSWPEHAQIALRGQPEEYYWFQILRDAVRRDPRLKSKDAEEAYNSLIRNKRAEAMPELMAAFLASVGESASESAQTGNTDKRRFLSVFSLAEIARPQDASLFDKYIGDRPGFDDLKFYVERARKRPPVEEPAESSFRLGHVSETPKIPLSPRR